MSTAFVTIKPTTLAEFVAFCAPLGFSWLTSRRDGKPFYGNEQACIALHGLEEMPCSDGQTRVGFSTKNHSLTSDVPAFEGMLISEHHDDYQPLFETDLDETKRTALIAMLKNDGMDETEAAARVDATKMTFGDVFEITPATTELRTYDDMICVMVDGVEKLTIILDEPLPLAA